MLSAGTYAKRFIVFRVFDHCEGVGERSDLSVVGRSPLERAVVIVSEGFRGGQRGRAQDW